MLLLQLDVLSEKRKKNLTIEKWVYIYCVRQMFEIKIEFSSCVSPQLKNCVMIDELFIVKIKYKQKIEYSCWTNAYLHMKNAKCMTKLDTLRIHYIFILRKTVMPYACKTGRYFIVDLHLKWKKTILFFCSFCYVI